MAIPPEDQVKMETDGFDLLCCLSGHWNLAPFWREHQSQLCFVFDTGLKRNILFMDIVKRTHTYSTHIIMGKTASFHPFVISCLLFPDPGEPFLISQPTL